MNRVKKESNVTYLDDVSTNPLDESVPVNIVNVNVTNIGVPINQRTNCVNKTKMSCWRIVVTALSQVKIIGKVRQLF